MKLITCRNFQLSTFSKAGIPNCLSFSLTIAFKSDHSMAKASLNKVENVMTNTTAASKYIPKRQRIGINCNPLFQTPLYKLFKIWFSLVKLLYYYKCAQLCINFCLVKWLPEGGGGVWIKLKMSWPILLQHQRTYLRGPKYESIVIPSFRPQYINFSKSEFY